MALLSASIATSAAMTMKCLLHHLSSHRGVWQVSDGTCSFADLLFLLCQNPET